MAASQKAGQILDTIFSIVLNEARAATNKAWKEFRILGALSGENYLRKAAEYKSVNDYLNLIKYAYYAKTGADQAPNILIFAGPVMLCALAIWAMNKEISKEKKKLRPEGKSRIDQPV